MKTESAKKKTGGSFRREVFAPVRKHLIQQLKDKGIRNERVLDAMLRVPRERFVEEEFVNLSYKDQALPIGCGQTISQPYVVAYMTEVLLNNGEPDNVLEIGTGCGYQTAILSHLVARVFTVECVASLQRKAKQLLKELGCDNTHFRCADGWKGWPQFAPYDGIIVTAAAPKVPPVLLEQLANGGRAIIPIGPDGGAQELTLITRRNDNHTERTLGSVRFVPLVEGKL